MSSWTHSICQECWNKQHPTRQPVRITPNQPSLTIQQFNNQIQTCCWCGNTHTNGTYLRADPQNLQCKGIHK